MGRRAVLATLAAAVFAGTAHAAPRLTVAPRSALVDATVRVRLTGAQPDERVRVVARLGSWTGSGVFRADAHGVVDLARDRSTGGSYRGRDPMGVFWSMRTTQNRGRGSPRKSVTVRLEARAHGSVVATTSVQWRFEATGVREQTTTLARDGFVGHYFVPPHPRRTPVLVFGGSEGGMPYVQPALLASHGFPTLALAYFREPGLPQSLVRVPLEYFVRAIRWLDRRPGIDASRLVVYGASRGSEPALLLGADFPKLVHGVVALVPTATVEPGLTTQPGPHPAWTLHGKPIAAGTPIAAGRIRGPVFLAGGVADGLWPSYSSVLALQARLHGHAGVVALTYGDAGHDLGYAVPNVPLLNVVHTRYGIENLGGTVAANARARADLWPKLLRFLAGA